MTRGSVAMPVQDIGYANHCFPRLGIEAKPFTDLAGHMPSDLAGKPHRLAFHHLMLVTSGAGTHRVDFEDHRCEPGTVIHVRPGQIHQYCVDDGEFEAHTVLFTPTFIGPRPASGSQCACDAGIRAASPESALRLEEPNASSIQRAFCAITEEYGRTDASAVSARILQHQLQALLLLLGRQSGHTGAHGEADRQHRMYLRFLAVLEARFAATRSVHDYACEIGTSPKTLHRACFALAGLSPKQIIERRVVLEAGRLLAHTSISTAELAATLGFSEATNFVKFFRRHEGVTPTAFRDRQCWRSAH